MARSQSYLGKVPPAKGTGPRNLPKTSTPKVGAKKPRPSKAATARVRPALASVKGAKIPKGGGGGMPKATTAMGAAPKKSINKPKTGRPRKGAGKPKASMKSRI